MLVIDLSLVLIIVEKVMAQLLDLSKGIYMLSSHKFSLKMLSCSFILFIIVLVLSLKTVSCFLVYHMVLCF